MESAIVGVGGPTQQMCNPALAAGLDRAACKSRKVVLIELRVAHQRPLRT
jgi:hypothetical protein